MMLKNCPYCKKESCSAITKGKWICPHCGKDITKVKSEVIDNSKLK